MGCRAWLVLLLPACSFQHGAAADAGPTTTGSGDASDATVVVDGPPDTSSVVSDARACYGTTDPVCLDVVPTGTLSLPGVSNPLDTGVDVNCTVVTGGFCVLAAQHVTVGGGFVAIGTRPLVILGSIDVTITGTVDVSSTFSPSRTGAGANASGCTSGNGASDGGGGGGGAGGSFGTKGGDGGTGDLNNNLPPAGTAAGGTASAIQTPAHLRGGCPGGKGGDGDDPGTNPGLSPGGAAGDSGGAVRVIAATMITVNGGIFASGAGGGTTTGNTSSCATNNGGYEQGGGGGGAGGMIWLDAPAVTVTGKLAANGGGGGGGGGCYGGTHGFDGTTTSWNMAASGGTGDTADGGGNGAAGAPSVAGNGAGANAGGGGGGGGLGVVWIDGTLTGGTQVSPAPSAH